MHASGKVTARQSNRVRCMECALVCDWLRLQPHQQARCPRCGARLHSREPGSLSRTWAWLLTGAILLLPANWLPIMTTTYMGSGQPDTIMSGILALAHENQLAIALLIFVASIVVPIVKLAGIALLLIVVQWRVPLSLHQCIWLYRFVEWIGRWSMLDLFMLSILVTLVNMGAFASVEPGAGATAFATVVVVTMLAAQAFDPRLLWDLRTETES